MSNNSSALFPPWVHVLDLYCGLASLLPVAFALYLCVKSAYYRATNKAHLVVNFVCAHAVCQLLQSPLRWYKINGGESG